jgi:hypothetical protein
MAVKLEDKIKEHYGIRKAQPEQPSKGEERHGKK